MGEQGCRHDDETETELADSLTMISFVPVFRYLTGIEVLALASVNRQFSQTLGVKNQQLWRHICEQLSLYTMLPFCSSHTQCYKETFINMMLPFVVRCHEHPNDFLLGYDRSAAQLATLVDSMHAANVHLMPVINQVNFWFHRQVSDHAYFAKMEQAQHQASYTFFYNREGSVKSNVFFVSDVQFAGNFESEFALPIVPGAHIFICYRRIPVSVTVLRTGVSPVLNSTNFTFPNGPGSAIRTDACCVVPRSATFMHMEGRMQLSVQDQVAWPHIISALSSCKCIKLLISCDRVSSITGYTCSRAGIRRGTLLKGDVCSSLVDALNIVNAKFGPDRRNWFSLLFSKRRKKSFERELISRFHFPNVSRFLRASPRNHICFLLSDTRQIMMPCSLLRQMRFDSILEALLELEHFWTEERVNFYQNLHLVDA